MQTALSLASAGAPGSAHRTSYRNVTSALYTAIHEAASDLPSLSHWNEAGNERDGRLSV